MSVSHSTKAADEGLFSAALADSDPEIADAIALELGRQRDEIELIASENIVSRAVLEAQVVLAGTVPTRPENYYGGCQFVDIAERLAIERVTRLFGCSFANVQPHSGASANAEVFMALMQPGDTFMGLNLAAGGHLTHGSPVNMSGRWFKVVPYGVRRDDHLIDMEEVERLAKEHRPKVIVAGGSTYPRIIWLRRFREVADEVGAYLMVDMAHFAGLVAGGAHPSPFPHAHVVSTTTHKTLRGPRGGCGILTNDEELAKKLNSRGVPGHAGRAADACRRRQGGGVRRGAAALLQTLREERGRERESTCGNAKVARARYRLRRHRYPPHAGRSARALRPAKWPKPRSSAHIDATRTAFRTTRPFVTSGVRLGTPAGTARGFGVDEFRQMAI